MFATVTGPAGRNDVAQRMIASLEQRGNMILREMPFGTLVAVGTAMVKRGLKREPLSSRKVANHRATLSRISSFLCRASFFGIGLSPRLGTGNMAF